jgi:uncharacterized membrane protein
MTEGQIQGGSEPLGLVLGILCIFFMGGTLGYFLINVRPLTGVLRRGGNVASRLVPAFAVAGVAVALYLGYVRLANSPPLCGPLVDCALVQTSRFADIAGVPVALLGIVANLAMLMLWWQQRRTAVRLATTLLLLLAGLFTVFSLYLTFVELFVLHAVCPWCLLSAMLFTAILATVSLLLLDQAPHPSYLSGDLTS